MKKLALVMALSVSVLASAQPFAADQKLLLTEGTLRGSPRLMGIAGAFVGLAEGAEGIPRNPASVAMKHVSFDGDWHYDFAGTMHFLPPWSTKQQDWDNDGRPDQAAAGPFDFLGTQVIYSFASIQYKSVALGVGFDVQNFLSRTRVDGDPVEYYHNVSLSHVYATLAASVWRDQILFGFGIESSHAFIGYAEQPPGNLLPNPKDTMGFHGWGLQLGAVWRPENEDWRVGISWKPQLTAGPFRAREVIGGKTAPSGVSVPGRLSLGGALALGPGRRLNITSPGGWVPRDDAPKPPVRPLPSSTGPPPVAAPKALAAPSGPPPPPPAPSPGRPATSATEGLTSAMTKWLFTAQLDVFFPVQGSTLVSSFLEQPEVTALTAGNRLSFQPRLGIEKELFADLLRLRVGTYLEAPVVQGSPATRPHLCFGFELALFRLGNERISLGLSFDFANLYQNLSVGILVWK